MCRCYTPDIMVVTPINVRGVVKNLRLGGLVALAVMNVGAWVVITTSALVGGVNATTAVMIEGS